MARWPVYDICKNALAWNMDHDIPLGWYGEAVSLGRGVPEFANRCEDLLLNLWLDFSGNLADLCCASFGVYGNFYDHVLLKMRRQFINRDNRRISGYQNRKFVHMVLINPVKVQTCS